MARSISLIICLIVGLGVSAQTYYDFARPSVNFDTLFLVKENTLAEITYKIWEDDTSSTKPVMVWVDQLPAIKEEDDENH